MQSGGESFLFGMFGSFHVKEQMAPRYWDSLGRLVISFKVEYLEF